MAKFGNKWTELLGDGEHGCGGVEERAALLPGDQSRAVRAALALLFPVVVFDCSLHFSTEKKKQHVFSNSKKLK